MDKLGTNCRRKTRNTKYETKRKTTKNIKTFKKYEGKSINLHPPKRKNLKIFYNTKLLKSNNPNKYFLKCNLLKLVKML
ncbi:hypothetical protein CV662_05860 [Borreliella burgdorferi]|nr:hypothetical protein CV662_05860 [Borreliella burgdorferi]